MALFHAEIDMILPTRAAPEGGGGTCIFSGLLVLFMSLACFVGGVSADTVRTVAGDILHGDALRLDKGKGTLKSPTLGNVNFPADKLQSVTTEKPVTVTFSNDARLVGRIIEAGNGLMRIVPEEGGASTPFVMVDVTAIGARLPGPVVRPEWKTSGNVNVGMTSSSGNKDARLIHADGKLTARRGRTRYNARAELNFRREDGEELANDALLKVKHDYFIRKKWFLYTSAGFEHDTAKELNLRTDLGTGAGYQIVDTARAAVSVEGGVSYVIDDFAEGEDSSYGALRWSSDLRYDPVLKKLSLFHFHELLGAVTSSDGMVARTRTGARYFMGNGFITTAQVKFDWDSDPAPGEEESDTTWMLTLGYAW